MKETDNIKMEINIAGEPLRLTVPFLSQNIVREAEKRVNDLFRSWTLKYPGMFPNQILAMVSYEFARLYCEMLEQTNSAIQMADAATTNLAEIIKKSTAKRNRTPLDSDSPFGYSRKKPEETPYPYMLNGEAEKAISPIDRNGMPQAPDDFCAQDPEEELPESDQTSFFTSY